jgi:hypothetical protein
MRTNIPLCSCGVSHDTVLPRALPFTDGWQIVLVESGAISAATQFAGKARRMRRGRSGR